MYCTCILLWPLVKSVNHEYPKDMFKLMGKKIFAVFAQKFCLSKPMIIFFADDSNPSLPVGFPHITEHPQDDYFAKNNPATLNCKAEGDPAPKITWYRDGKPVETTRDNPLSHRMLLDNGQLFFLRVIHSKNNHPDIGEYYCNATNRLGTAISRLANIQIAGTVARQISNKIRWSHNGWHLHTGKCIRRFAGIYVYCRFFIDRKW